MGAGVNDFGVTIGGKVGKVLPGILTQSLLAWNLGPAGRGSLAICLVYSSLLVIIFSMASDTAAVYFVSSRRFSISEGVIYTIFYGAIASMAAMAAGWFAIGLPLAFFQQAAPEEFKLALLLVPATLFGVDLPRLFTAVFKFRIFAGLVLAHSFLQLIFTVLFVWILRGSVRGALWASIWSAGIVVVISLVLFRRECGLRWVRPTASNLGAMLKYGLRYYLAKISNMMNLQVGPIILAFFATRAEIGWFAVAARLTNLVEMIPDSMTAVLIPRAAGHQEGRSRLVARASRIVGVVCGVILIALAVVAQPLIRLVFSPEFLPAVPFIRIIALGLIIRCMSKVTISYLLGTDHPGVGAVAVAAGVSVNLAAMWYLLPRVGVIGAPWGMTISYLVSSAIILGSFSRLSGLSLKEIFTFRRSDWSEMGKLADRLAGKYRGQVR